MKKTIDIGKEFSDYLVNRTSLQGDGKDTAVDFRRKFLKDLEDDAWWKDPDSIITLNFKNVKTLGPSWANEVFAHYRKNHETEEILKKIRFEDISNVKREIIEQEIKSGDEIEITGSKKVS